MDAAAEHSPRINHRGNHRLVSLVALLFATAPPSSANLLTKMNLRKTRGVAAASGGGGQPFELLLPKDQLNQGDVDVDVHLICDATRGNAFKFDIDGFIDDEEEGNSVSCCSAVFVRLWDMPLGAPHHLSSCVMFNGGTSTLHICHSNLFFSPLVPLIITLLLVYNFTGNL